MNIRLIWSTLTIPNGQRVKVFFHQQYAAICGIHVYLFHVFSLVLDLQRVCQSLCEFCVQCKKLSGSKVFFSAPSDNWSWNVEERFAMTVMKVCIWLLRTFDFFEMRSKVEMFSERGRSETYIKRLYKSQSSWPTAPNCNACILAPEQHWLSVLSSLRLCR